MRSPIKWFGGKGKMAKKLLPLIPQHKTYVEPFGGGASLLLVKPPSPIEVYNDIDSGLVNFFMVLSDPDLFKKFYRRIAVLPYSRELYHKYRNEWAQETDPITKAVKWFVVTRQSFGGRFNSGWGFNVTKTSKHMAEVVSTWLSAIELLPETHNRLQKVQVECLDWRKIIEIYDRPETFFYLDPPYILSTRKSGGYLHELSTADHEELIKIILNIKGKVLLSGYPSEIYQPLEKAGWHTKEWRTSAHTAGRTRNSNLQGKGAAMKKVPRTEKVWMNYTTERRLFDGCNNS